LTFERHRYIGPPRGKYNCPECGKPVEGEKMDDNWAYYMFRYYHSDCLHRAYPKKFGGVP